MQVYGRYPAVVLNYNGDFEDDSELGEKIKKIYE